MEPRTLLDLTRQFSTEKACFACLAAIRFPDGFKCPDCDAPARSFRADHRAWICRNNHEVSLTVDTMLHRTKQPLVLWFHALWLVAENPRLTVRQLQEALSLSRAATAWGLLHKIKALQVGKCPCDSLWQAFQRALYLAMRMQNVPHPEPRD